MDNKGRIILFQTVFTELDDPKIVRICDMRELNDEPPGLLETESIGEPILVRRRHLRVVTGIP